jgi:4,5-DOPA dioxygenase extradiol
MKFPAIFVNHGGGPMPLMGAQPHLAQHMKDVIKLLPEKPKSIVVLSAHWESNPIQITNYKEPRPLLYDYGGFPPETYKYQYPAPGSQALSKRIQELLEAEGIMTSMDESRGFDHGVFVPLKIMYPDADIPVVAVSMAASLDVNENMKIGQALAPLRDEDVLILGSGFTFHNMRAFFNATDETRKAAKDFNEWLKETMSSSPSVMKEHLANWAQAPGGRISHPREEHLLPLMMVAAASDFSAATVVYDTSLNTEGDHAVTGYLFN